MKPKVKKLMLNRETVRRLDSNELHGVAGGTGAFCAWIGGVVMGAFNDETKAAVRAVTKQVVKGVTAATFAPRSEKVMP